MGRLSENQEKIEKAGPNHEKKNPTKETSFPLKKWGGTRKKKKVKIPNANGRQESGEKKEVPKKW